jgi:hypothetical protein
MKHSNNNDALVQVSYASLAELSSEQLTRHNAKDSFSK